MKRVFGVLLIITGIALGLYVGGWVLCIKPILACAAAFDAHILTATMVAWAIVKFIFAAIVGWVIFYIGYYLGLLCFASSNLSSLRKYYNRRIK